jgi:hypothetical protein
MDGSVTKWALWLHRRKLNLNGAGRSNGSSALSKQVSQGFVDPARILHIDQSFAIFNLSLRGAQRRGNLDEVEHTSANRRCYDDEIATLRSQ